MRIRLFVLALAAGAAFASAANAETRIHHHPHRLHVAAAGNQVVVHKRSFLDSGVVVPVGSESAYTIQSTLYNSMPGINNRAEFQEDLLPGPLGQPAGMPGFLN